MSPLFDFSVRARAVVTHVSRSTTATALLVTALSATSSGCYLSHEREDTCAPSPACLEGATTLCLRELAPFDTTDVHAEPACREVEVTARSRECASSDAHVHIDVESGEPHALWYSVEVLELAPGESFAGVVLQGYPECVLCGGGGVTDDSAEVGATFSGGTSVEPGTGTTELVLLGRGTRYRVQACAVERAP